MKIYAEKTRELAEDWAPTGVSLPDLINKPPCLASKIGEKSEAMNIYADYKPLHPPCHLSIKNQYDSLGHLIEKENQFYRSQTNLRPEDKFFYLKKVDTTSQNFSEHQLIKRNLEFNGRSNQHSYFAVHSNEEKPYYQNFFNTQNKALPFEKVLNANVDHTGMTIDINITEDLYNKSREELISEISSLRAKIRRLQIIMNSPANQLLLSLQVENEKLQTKIRFLESKALSPEKNGNHVSEQSFHKKINFLQQIIQSSEIERSQLLARTNLTEEQLKILQEKYRLLVKESQEKINQLKHQLKIFT